MAFYIYCSVHHNILWNDQQMQQYAVSLFLCKSTHREINSLHIVASVGHSIETYGLLLNISQNTEDTKLVTELTDTGSVRKLDSFQGLRWDNCNKRRIWLVVCSRRKEGFVSFFLKYTYLSIRYWIAQQHYAVLNQNFLSFSTA